MQVSFSGTSIVQETMLPEGLLAQVSPMIASGQFPGQCNPSAYISSQQAASLVDTSAGGFLSRVNAWVNDNKMLAAGLVVVAFMASGGKLGK